MTPIGQAPSQGCANLVDSLCEGLDVRIINNRNQHVPLRVAVKNPAPFRAGLIRFDPWLGS